MAIVKMYRFSLLTFHTHRRALLKELQQFGELHIKNLEKDELLETELMRRGDAPADAALYEAMLEQVCFALRMLAPYAPKQGARTAPTAMSKQEFEGYLEQYDFINVYEQLRELDERLNALKGECDKLRSENDAMEPWLDLDVSPGDLDTLQEACYFLGTMNKAAVQKLEEQVREQYDDVYLERLGAVKGDAEVLLLAPEELQSELSELLRDGGFSRPGSAIRGVPREIIAENQRQLDRLAEELEATESAVSALVDEYVPLQTACDCLETLLERERVRQNFLQSDTVLLIQGWVPQDSSPAFREILETGCAGEYYMELEDVEKESGDVPIKLRHNKLVEPFFSITAMYSMPRYNEVDPTPIFTPFYILFFGLMVGDMGYGLVMIVATAIMLKFFHFKEGMQRMLRMFFVLGFSVFAAGLVYGGMFGVEVFSPIPYQVAAEGGGMVTAYKPILSSSLDIMSMLILSIILGVVHIYTGLLTKVYVCVRDKHFMDAFCDGLLWILSISTGVGWLLGIAGVFPAGIWVDVCKWGFIASLVILALTQGRMYPSLAGKIGGGLYGVYGITSYVGDFVSYTRIVALALSGAYIALSFNMMGGLIPAGPFGIVRILFGGIVVVAGQTLNLGLSLLSAYVHTSRLQYVEFFGKFFEGGGVVYAPFGLKHKYIQIKN